MMLNVTTLRREDDIDAGVDNLVAHPLRAERLKAEQRRRFRVVEPAPAEADEMDWRERFWDNVPL